MQLELIAMYAMPLWRDGHLWSNDTGDYIHCIQMAGTVNDSSLLIIVMYLSMVIIGI